MKIMIIVAQVGLLGSGTPETDEAGRPKGDRDDQTAAPMVTGQVRQRLRLRWQ